MYTEARLKNCHIWPFLGFCDDTNLKPDSLHLFVLPSPFPFPVVSPRGN